MILVGGKQGCNREEEEGGSAKDGLVAARFASETRGPRASSSVEQRLGASATRPFKTLSQSNLKSATKPQIVVVEGLYRRADALSGSGFGGRERVLEIGASDEPRPTVVWTACLCVLKLPSE